MFIGAMIMFMRSWTVDHDYGNAFVSAFWGGLMGDLVYRMTLGSLFSSQPKEQENEYSEEKEAH